MHFSNHDARAAVDAHTGEMALRTNERLESIGDYTGSERWEPDWEPTGGTSCDKPLGSPQ